MVAKAVVVEAEVVGEVTAHGCVLTSPPHQQPMVATLMATGAQAVGRMETVLERK